MEKNINKKELKEVELEEVSSGVDFDMDKSHFFDKQTELCTCSSIEETQMTDLEKLPAARTTKGSPS